MDPTIVALLAHLASMEETRAKRDLVFFDHLQAQLDRGMLVFTSALSQLRDVVAVGGEPLEVVKQKLDNETLRLQNERENRREVYETWKTAAEKGMAPPFDTKPPRKG